MPENSNFTLSTATFDVAGLRLPVELRRHPRARRLRLRIDHDRSLIRLTIPARSSARHALRWAGEQADWVEAQLAIAAPASPLADGATIPFLGVSHRIVATGGRRGVSVCEGILGVGGPTEGLSGRLERWLRAEARIRLAAATTAIAGPAGITIAGVSVGDPVSRWGSCSAKGAIRYSWRLVLAPPEALTFVVAHEVAHRLHMDHSPAFKAAEQRLFGAPVAPARALLRRLGPALRAVGRG